MKYLLFVFMVGGLFLTGCIPVFLGAGAVAGYTLSNDSAIGIVEAKFSLLWSECLTQLKKMSAEIKEVDESKGIIKAVVLENDVVFKINTIELDIQQLKISARKYLLPKPHVAQRLYLRIIKALK